MQKKLMAVAVAGALAAPAAVMAQSTVQVYGNLYMEYAFTSQGRSTGTTDTNHADRVNADIFQSGGSEIGFKGEEKLGGGLSAWFQCNSTADPRGISQSGWCGRNSAVGMKGSFGNLFVGVWDTPFKRTIGAVGGRDTGVFGTAYLLAGDSTTVTDGASPGVFKRRQRNSINYDSPKFGGFQFMAATASTNSSTGLTATAPNAKARVWSLAGAYAQGPLSIGVGYERHKNFYNNGTPGTGAISGLANGTTTFAVAAVNPTVAGDESGYHVSVAYTFGGNVKVGGTFTEQKADTLAAAAVAANEVKVKAYHLGVEWKLSGPHNVHVGYTKADDVKGLAGSQMAPVSGTAVGLRPTVAAAGVATGADMWQIRYLHDFSKRTIGSIGYVSLKNDRGASYDLGGLNYGGNLQSSGAKQSAVAVSIQHKF